MTDLRVAATGDLDAAMLYELMKLRSDVFVVEQDCAYPDLDGRDLEPATRHLWNADDAGPTAYLRVLEDGDRARIGRVCTRSDARGAGLAGDLLRAALELCAGREVVLEAQSHLASWYARFGFATDGAQYVEDGIPHTPMRRTA